MFIKGIEEKYPEKILYNRHHVEGQVIGLLAKDLLFLDESNLDVSDFKTEEGRMYFKIEQEIRRKGYNALDEVTVLSNIPENLQEKFDEYGGYDGLNNLADIIDTKNSDSIFDALHRENIIMKLYDDGFNILNTMKDEKDREFVPVDKFRKMPSEMIINWYDIQLNNISVGYNTKILDAITLVTGYGNSFTILEFDSRILRTLHICTLKFLELI